MSKQTEIASMKRRQRGVTLVELMISLLLGMLLTAGIIKVFVGNSATYAFNQSLSRIQENARYTLDHIAYVTRMAGYTGCISDVTVYNNLNPNPFRDDIGNGLQGYDSNGEGGGTGAGDSFVADGINPGVSTDENDWTPALPTELDNLVIPGSDVLVVRGISGSSSVSLVSPFNDSAQLFADEPHDFKTGDVLVVSDCQKASIFQVTNNTTGNGNLAHGNASMTPGNTVSNWSAEQNYGLGAQVARLQTYAFFVGSNNNGSPALFQLRLHRVDDGETSFGDAEELVAGIDTMQVRYGEDTDGDGGVNIWRSADEVTDWSDVSSVEIALLARAEEEYGTVFDKVVYNIGGTQFDPVDDRRLRQVFSTTIGVRNRLP